MRKENKKYTIYDIAKRSGYSPKTVSRVINGGEKVKAETFHAIKKVMEELSYTPNAYAQNLSQKNTTNILISVKKKEKFPLIWFQTLLDQVLIASKEYGVNTVVEYFDENDSISDSIISNAGSLIDGVILFYEVANDIRIDYLKQNNVPFIIFGKSQDEQVPYVSNNDFQALFDMTEKIEAENCQTMWMLMGGRSLVNKERERGVREYLLKNTSDIKLEVFYDLATIQSIYEFSVKKFENELLPDIIFVSGDEKVQGVIRACYEKNIKIPEDVAIVGFDNIPISQYYTPALTTIAPDYMGLAKEMIEGLLGLIKGVSFESKEIETRFIRRKSF
ncbi:LacI family DNA-binding transcriptional regulator [Streptococcus oralis]|uniref:Catabolite control protein A n=1 Tax=Streptococcus oralis TaxID=1303 RepID=A0A139QR26_STROR|nr:LacI family DNA-binding transcriptional regulator [Streptococcus oralis]KXU04974.1 Catabolite control protein A [Streptococcus oralis]